MANQIDLATTGYVAAGGLGGGVGAASMLAFIKPKTAWAGLAQVCIGVTWGAFGGRTLASMLSNVPGLHNVVNGSDLFHITLCAALLGCCIYYLVGALSRYFIKHEKADRDIVEMVRATNKPCVICVEKKEKS